MSDKPNVPASRIDHTLLKPEAGVERIDRLTDEAIEHGFAAVCVNPVFARRVIRRLSDAARAPADKPPAAPLRSCSVVGFPLGANNAKLKAAEAVELVREGVEEIDVVAHLPLLLACDVQAAAEELQEVVHAAREVQPGVVVKVIIESALLLRDVREDHARRRVAGACEAARRAGCDFVKTSTGFHPAGGAMVDAVRMIQSYAQGLQIKAAGGIRTREDAWAMIEAGADRLGCSASVDIVST